MPERRSSALVSTERATHARGVLYVHACPRALCRHLEWTVTGVLGGTGVMGAALGLDWTQQPLASPAMRAEHVWRGSPGTGARLASALLTFPGLRYEVTEDPTPDREGERFAVTPELGLFRAGIGAHGDIVVPEDRLRAALLTGADDPSGLVRAIEDLLGAAWDRDLEPFRVIGADSGFARLHDVG